MIEEDLQGGAGQNGPSNGVNKEEWTDGWDGVMEEGAVGG